ncbi:hypothetical protein [Halorubrum sp. SP9]|uniref:hypothetical protein n=1 Tax=Halorubrum sp. SP9 TaxID=1537267 RepID=UPI0010F628F9|nr:hypothetical protein [Halorubrum sp. SP9]TKX68978.1 hypothetical protein EXE45_09965 [Halorubrum sp. SP9]
MTDRSAERPAERSRTRAAERARDRTGEGPRSGADEEVATPVASMDVAPELFPAEPTGDETERGAE